MPRHGLWFKCLWSAAVYWERNLPALALSLSKGACHHASTSFLRQAQDRQHEAQLSFPYPTEKRPDRSSRFLISLACIAG